MFWATSSVRTMGQLLKAEIEAIRKRGQNEAFEKLAVEFKNSDVYSHVEQQGNRLILVAKEMPFHFETSKNHVTGGLNDVEALGSGPYWGFWATREVESETGTVCFRDSPTLKARQLKSFFAKELGYMDIGKIYPS